MTGVQTCALPIWETFTFPAGIGPVECVNVEHEEVLLIPRWVKAKRVTFKYGLGAEFIGVLRTLHKLGLDRTDPVPVGPVSVSPRDVVAACLPDPATLGDKMTGLTCAGTWVSGTGADGGRREEERPPVPDAEVVEAHPRRERAHHVLGAVGEIDDVEHAEDHGKAQAEQRIERAVDQAEQKLPEQGLRGYAENLEHAW